MRALIVDDEEDIGLMVSTFLRKEGMEADHANLIKNARQMIHENEYQLFFLDLKLPDGTGFDLVPDIKSNVKDPKLIIISAYDGDIETKKAKQLGIDIFIKKPFTKSEIIQAIHNLS